MSRIKLFSLTIASLMFAVAVSAQTIDDFNEKYNAAGALYGAKKYSEAIKGFEEAIEIGQKVGEAAVQNVVQSQKLIVTCYNMLSTDLAKAGKFEEAIESYKKTAEMAELYNVPATQASASRMIAQIYLNMGGNAYNAKDYAKAADVFSKGYAYAPENTKLALYLAESYDKLDSLNKAVEIYKGVMSLTHSKYAEDVAKAKTEYTNMMLMRASKAAETNNLDAVVKYTGDVLEVDAKNAMATMMRLQTANNAKKFRAVIEYAPAAIEAQTADDAKMQAYYLLGVAYQNLEDKANAIENLKKVTSGKFAEPAKKLITELNKPA